MLANSKWMNDDLWLYIIIIASVLAFLIAFFAILNVVVSKKKNHKMYNDIMDIFKEISSKNENITYEKIIHTKNDNIPYDFTLFTENYNYYVKVIPNYQNYEITINNSIKWQLRRSNTDESLNFVNGVEKFMRMELDNKEKKPNKKLYIIYPSSKLVLKYVNECEMEFVNPKTDIYGTNVITYTELKENKDLIEI